MAECIRRGKNCFKYPLFHLLLLSLKYIVELDLQTVVPCCSGPKRPQDKVAVSDMKKDFETCLGAKVNGFICFATKFHFHPSLKN